MTDTSITNEIITSVDLMSLASDLDDTNEAYRAALIAEAEAEAALTQAHTTVNETALARTQAMHALVNSACTAPMTAEFWASPLDA